MRWWTVVGMALALMGAAPAGADSWEPATRQTYQAPGAQVRFTVVPREISDPLSFFTDKAAAKEPAGQQAGGEARARGILERRAGGKWMTVWTAPLVNDVAPVSALVATDGGYVVTFDNWHSVGLGEHVVVIYRGDGSVVRSFTLTDILPEDYVRALPRSVSSLWWGGKHVLSADGRTLMLKVVVPSAGALAHRPRSFVDVAVDLASGEVAPLGGPDWDRAQAAAAPIAARDKAGEARWRADTIAPLSAPAGTGKDDWKRYLNRAVSRLGPQAHDLSFAPTWVLPAPPAPGNATK